MNKKILILSILSIIVVLALLVWIFYNPLNTSSSDDTIIELITPVITIDIDKYNQTTTILSIENGTDLFWSNVELVNGTATLPTGSIDEGDIITECIGILDFKWKPTNEVFLHCEFLRGDE
jgi:branched-subunit amino acid transport protein AzlD